MNIRLNNDEAASLIAETISRNLNVPTHELTIEINNEKYLTVYTLLDGWCRSIGKTNDDINLASVKIPLIKLFRSLHLLTGQECSLKCSKEFVEGHTYNP